MTTILKDLPCGCVLVAVLIDGVPVLGLPMRVDCDTSVYGEHCALARAEFMEHSLGYLLAHCGWTRGIDYNDVDILSQLHDDSVAEEP